MNRESRVSMHKGAAALVGLALLFTGAGASYVFMRGSTGAAEQIGAIPTAARSAPPPSGAQPSAAGTATRTAPMLDVVVPLTTAAIERAGIVVAAVASGTSAAAIRLPGIIEPHAYRQVAVTPIVSGRVTGVSAELGDRVQRGQTMAQIYSPELAEAHTRYVSARAMLEAHDRQLARTEKLVDIGAASRQELERIHAEHAAQTAAVQSARSQLELLGVPASVLDAVDSGTSVSATIRVPAPIDGIVTERGTNVGLNVDPATRLFTVVDLSTVWVVADVYEQDVSRIHIGSEVTITTAAYPEQVLRGRVSYMDPQVSPDTRTASVRVEVPNPRGELRLGMYADVVVTGAAGTSVPVIPRSAVQNVADRTVVYLVNPKDAGTFIEREVRLGPASGNQVEVVSGVHPADLIVTEGSFFVRAERERLGLRSTAGLAAAGDTAPSQRSSERGDADVQTAKVVVNELGFEPAKFSLRAATPARITFVRTTDKTCGTEVVFPSLNIKRPLPLNEPVVIEFTPTKSGAIAFACGMNMFQGTIVVQ